MIGQFFSTFFSVHSSPHSSDAPSPHGLYSVTPRHVTSRHGHVTSRHGHVTSRHVTSRHVTPRSRHVTSRHGHWRPCDGPACMGAPLTHGGRGVTAAASVYSPGHVADSSVGGAECRLGPESGKAPKRPRPLQTCSQSQELTQRRRMKHTSHSRNHSQSRIP